MTFRTQHLMRLAVVLCFVASVTAHGALAASGSSIARIPFKGNVMLKNLADHGIEVLTLGRDGYIDVSADAGQLAYLFSLGIPVSVVQTPDMTAAAPALDANLGEYHTYAEMESVLTDFATTYPAITSLSSMGQSIEGRELYVLKISDNPTVDEGEPEVLIMGNLHARELMAVEIPLKFAIYLLHNYGVDATVTDMVNNREIFIVPMANPDGHVYVELNHGGSSSNWWRKNRRVNANPLYPGVDLNRNFGYQWGYDDIGSSPLYNSQVYRGTGPFSEPETQAIRDFCNAHHFVTGLSYHSYGELLLYPWGYYNGYTPDHEVFKAMADSMAAGTGYLAGNPVTGAIYITNGDSDDWAYGENSTKPSFFLFTPEVNSIGQGGFGPAESYIQPTFDLLLPMNMRLLQLAGNPYGVVGPFPPTMYAVDDSWSPNYMLRWSQDDPSDPNPVASYDVVEYKNLGTIPQDGANVASPLWNYSGFSVSTTRKYEGAASYYSGAVNNASRTLTAATLYSVNAMTATFSCELWYDIESGYDYAYLEASTDQGLTWATIPGNRTTTASPNGANHGNGITGSSGGGWVAATFDLTGFIGEDIQLRFDYVTDAAYLGEGIYVDALGPVPTVESESIIATGIVGDTTLVVSPTSTGEFTYLVRARDADGQLSRWSNSVRTTVDQLTGTRQAPVLSTRLGRNYPNPFNPITSIPYSVGAAAARRGPVQVALTIYDATGARVIGLVHRELPTGLYQATWDGRSDRGEPVASGVYFARLAVTGEPAAVRKLVLLK